MDQPGMTTSQWVRAACAARLGEPDAETEFEQGGLWVSVLVDGLRVTVLMAAPVFADELDHFREHGTDALWDRMEEAGVPMGDPRRVSTFPPR
jgi:hypothetical protein